MPPPPPRPPSRATSVLVATFVLVFGVAGVLALWRPWVPGRLGLRRAPTDAAQPADATAAPTSFESEVAPPIATLDGGPAEAAASAAVTSTWTRRKLNVVLITVDTLRFDLGYAGYARPISPNLDAFAARSAVFERVYATAPYTMKALAALLTGRYTAEAARDYQHYTHYYPSNVFLAERIKAAGNARTVAVMCHRYFGMKPGFEQGFDVYDLAAIPPGMTDSDPRPTSELLTDVTLRLLAKPENTPTSETRLFAWIHYFDPHAPYVGHPGAPQFGKMESTSKDRSRDVYDDEVWFTDKHIGRLLDFIRASSWANDTAIIVTADHGEAFGEKGHYRHGRELWEPLVRVPFLLYLPGAAPRRIETKRSHIDLVPTVLDLMGIPEEAPALRGKSLLPDVLAESDGGKVANLPERDVLFDVPPGQMNEARRGILTGPTPGMKLLVRGKGPKGVELYDLAADPEEAHDLAGDAARLDAARTRFDALVSGLEEQTPPH